MGREDKIFRYRKDFLSNLPQQLAQDFGIASDALLIADHDLASSDCGDELQGQQQESVIAAYNKFLHLATSTGECPHAETSTAVHYQPSTHGDLALPLYDDVPLSSASDDIRLLQLLPGDHDEPIVCNLFHVESVDLYDYEALSYVWGSVDSPRIIYVNGWEMAITENLDTALRALRHEQECRLLWLDAICIDQSLIPEKTRQVGKMGDIYKAAARVLVFLGPQTEASDTVIDFFEDGYSKLPDLGHNTKGGALSGLDAAAYLIEHHLPVIKAFVDVLFRPWFSRVWVRQEYIRAKEVPRLYCGRRNLDFPEEAFNLLCEAVFLLPTLLKQPMSEILATHQFHQVFSRAVSVFQLMNSTNFYPECPDNLLLNEGIGACEATDPRDLIFGVCALFDSVSANVLKADYSQSTRDVFMKASAWMLMMEQSPRMLVQYPPLEGPGIPTWVMDYTRARPTSRHHEFVATFDSNILPEEATEQDDGDADSKQDEEQQPTDPGLNEDAAEGDAKEADEEAEKQPAEDEGETYDPTVRCTMFHQVLSISGADLDTIAEVHQFSSDDRLETVKMLWQMEKIFQTDKPLPAKESLPPAIESLQSPAFILQWALKLPINHMVSMLVPRSEYFLEYVAAELDDFVVQLEDEVLEDLLGALLFDYDRFDFEMRGHLDIAQLSNPSSPTDVTSRLSQLSLSTPRYEVLKSHLISTDEARNARLLQQLQQLATEVLPNLLAKPDPPRSPRINSFASSCSSSAPSSPEPTLHSLPRTQDDLLQAWENEREDIFSQLFRSFCFFRTTHGLPGLGAFGLQGLRAGDRLVILHDVPMPMVLRKCAGDEEGEMWGLVGPVVVRGIMGGEATGMVRDGKIERRVFKIR